MITTENELLELLTYGERLSLECKKAETAGIHDL